jgi:hypothetical protein
MQDIIKGLDISPIGNLLNLTNGLLGGIAPGTGSLSTLTGNLPDLNGSLGSTVGDVDQTITQVADSVSPGASSENTTIGNAIGQSGVIPDVADNLSEGSIPGTVADSYYDLIGPGSVVNNLSEGFGLGIESALVQHLPLVDGLPLVPETVHALNPAVTTVGDLNDSIVQIAEDLSPGSSFVGSTTGNIIGESGIVPDIVDGLDAGSVSDGVLGAYRDVIGPGGIVNNLFFDGYGAGVESALHEYLPIVDGLSVVSDGLGVLSPVATTLGDLNGSIVQAGEDVSPGSSSTSTTTGHLIGQSGVIEDVASNLQSGSLSGAVLNAYDDLIGPGSVVHSLGHGGGLGTESLVGQLGHLGILQHAGDTSGALNLASGATDLLGALLGGADAEAGAGAHVSIADTLGSGLLSGLTDHLDLPILHH